MLRNISKEAKKTAEVLKILKEAGIDITKIKQNDTTDILLSGIEKSKLKNVLSKIQNISGHKTFMIGQVLQSQRTLKQIPMLNYALISTLDGAGRCIFSEEEITTLIGTVQVNKVKESKTKRKREQLISILTLLKRNGIDITKIRQQDKLQDILGEVSTSQFKSVINQVREITGEENFPIGSRIQAQKRPENIVAFRDALINELDSSQQHVFDEDEIALLLHKKRIKAVELGMATYDASTDICIEMDRVLEEARNKTVALETADKKGDDIGELS